MHRGALHVGDSRRSSSKCDTIIKRIYDDDGGVILHSCRVVFRPLLKLLWHSLLFWCDRNFYDTALDQGEDIEIVFVSRDRSENDAKSYFRGHHGPWLMLQFQHPLGDQLMRALGIRSIPSLHVINEFGHSVVENARETVVQNVQSRLEGAVSNTISQVCMLLL